MHGLAPPSATQEKLIRASMGSSVEMASVTTDSNEGDHDGSSRATRSPSTAYTSVNGDEAAIYEDNAVRKSPRIHLSREPFSSNQTAPLNEGGRNEYSPSTESLALGNAANIRTWRIPFRRVNENLKPSTSPSQSPIAAGPSVSPSSTSGVRRKGASDTTSTSTKKSFSSKGTSGKTHVNNSQDTQRLSIDDGSFVETTSSHAAHALAQYWNEVQAKDVISNMRMAGAKGKGREQPTYTDYVVVARVENGKKIYRIRPRSRPRNSFGNSRALNKTSVKDPQSSDQAQLQQTLRAPSIRLTRSIPNLRSQPNALASIHRDRDGFYRPLVVDRPDTRSEVQQQDMNHLSLPLDSTHHILASTGTSVGPSVSRLRTPTLQTASSIPNLRAHRDNDIFGRLLGWEYPRLVNPNADSPHQRQHEGLRVQPPPADATNPPKQDLVQNDQLSDPYNIDHAGSSNQVAVASIATTASRSLPDYNDLPIEMKTPISQVFPSIVQQQESVRNVVDSHNIRRQSTFGHAEAAASRDQGEPFLTGSPFGLGVRHPSSPRLRRRKSVRELHSLLNPPATIVAPGMCNEAPIVAAATHKEGLAAKSDQAHALREVASSETIRFAHNKVEPAAEGFTGTLNNKLSPASHAVEAPTSVEEQTSILSTRDWTTDIRIYDSFYQSTEPKDALSGWKETLKPEDPASINKRHQRGTSNASLVSLGISIHSSASVSSTGDLAHDITVTSLPGDDPRLVIWGLKAIPQLQRPKQAPFHSSNAYAGSGDSPASFSSSGPAASSASSNRSSGQRRYAYRSDTIGSPSYSTDTSTGATSPTSTAAAPVGQRVLMAATVDRWIADMTSRIEVDLMTEFFLTYRSFLSSLTLCKLLITRFEWALQPGNTAEDLAGKRIVRVRTYVVLRHWILNYFHEDFVPNRDLRITLTAWLNRMGKDDRLRANTTDLRLIKSLKKVVKRLKAAYSTVGVEAAVGANALIGSSGDARPPTTGRSRSDSAMSTSSLHSIREESADPSLHDKLTVASPHSSRPATLNNPTPDTNSHPSRQDVRTSSSEDDVDLEIDIRASGYDSDEAPRFPPIIPISPPRPRHHSPSAARKSRSPSSLAIDRSPSMLAHLPVSTNNHRFSRYISSTMGSINKFKRIMGARHSRPILDVDQTQHYVGQGPRIMSNVGSLDQRLLATSQNEHPHLGKDDISDTKPAIHPGLGIYGFAAGKQSLPHSAASSTPNLRHIASNGTMREVSTVQPAPESRVAKAHQELQAALGQVHAPSELEPPFNLSSPAIQLDEYESSDDDALHEPYPVRTLRRAPAARDLRRTEAPQFDPAPRLLQRHSIDTISSYGTKRTPTCALEPLHIPSMANYDADFETDNIGDDQNALAGQGLVPFFVPPEDSEDDEEPGDVEAALRRLEGQVDQEKQRDKAKKVAKYLKRSEEAKANGGYLYEEANTGRGDEDDPDVQDPVLDTINTPEGASPHVPLSKAEELSVSPLRGQEDQAGAYPPEDSRILAAPTTEIGIVQADRHASPFKNRTVQRKSSMRRFFGSNILSTTFRPVAASERTKRSEPNNHHSCILQFKLEALAKSFCVIERDLLEKVTWQELINGTWKGRLDVEDFTDWDSFMKMRAKLNAEVHDFHSPGPAYASETIRKIGDVQTIIHRFNLTCKWVASEIVLTTQTTERAFLIGRFIKLAFKSYQMYNFQTVTQIIHALQLPPVERLKKTWSKVPSFEMKLFTQLKFFTSPLRDFRLLREATNTLASQWGPPGQEARDPDMTLPGVPGALPFFGLILRDLTVANELPTFLDPSSPRAPAVIDAETLLLPAYADPAFFADLPPLPEDLPLRPLINVHKYRTIASTVQQVMSFKELAATYPYEATLPLYRKCLTMQCLPMHVIARLSTACEK